MRQRMTAREAAGGRRLGSRTPAHMPGGDESVSGLELQPPGSVSIGLLRLYEFWVCIGPYKFMSRPGIVNPNMLKP